MAFLPLLLGLWGFRCPGPDPQAGGEGGQGSGAAGGEGAAGGSSPEGCPSGSTECDGVCVNTDSDNANCGTCGNACGESEACSEGSCTLACPGGWDDCDGACVNTDIDREHCGQCDNGCDAGQVCDGGGTCAATCQAGRVDCGGSCIDPDTDETFCGAGPDCSVDPGTTCAAGEICDGSGTCALSCQNGLVDCGGTCIDPLVDETFCGAGPDCSLDPGTTCLAGEVCDGAGSCALSCQGGLVDCGGTCVDPLVDEGFCGAGPDCAVNAGTVCLAGEVCDGSGNCALNCQAGFAECGGSCVDPSSDEAWCGASLDCVNPGQVCGPGESCNLGVCEVSCPIGQIDCGGQCIDPLINQQFCGAGPDCSVNPGLTCQLGELCISGICEACVDPLEVPCNGVCCAADEACVANACVPMLENGSFETGDFTGWTAIDLAMPFFPLVVETAGAQADQLFFFSNPTDGVFHAFHGFDGDGPGEISLGQDVVVVGNAVLNYDYRAAWDIFAGTFDREFEIRIEPSGGGVPLLVVPELTAPIGTFVDDTGDLFGQLDMSPFDGQTVFLRFVWIIPEPFTGPGQFQLDNVTLARQ